MSDEKKLRGRSKCHCTPTWPKAQAQGREARALDLQFRDWGSSPGS